MISLPSPITTRPFIHPQLLAVISTERRVSHPLSVFSPATLIKASSRTGFVRLLLFEQIRSYPLIERIFQQFDDLAPQVFVPVLFEKHPCLFVDYRRYLEVAICPEFDVLAVPEHQPVVARVLGKRLRNQSRKFIHRQIPGRKTERVHSVYVLNQDFLSALREIDNLEQNFGDVIRSHCRQVHIRPPWQPARIRHRILAASLSPDFQLG
jgi:hypothetical protein